MSRREGVPACADPARVAVGDLFQPFSPAYLESPARAFYLRAHAEAPVSYSRTFGAWMCTGHAEVTAVLRAPQVFSSKRILDLPPQPQEVYEVLSRAVFPLPPGLFNNDPPGHTRARALFSSALSPARVAALEPTIRRLVAELIHGLSERRGTVDLMSTFAFPLLLRMSASLAGIPVKDAPMLKAWQEDWFELYRTDLSVAQRIEAARGVVAHHSYLRELVQDRRRSAADDFVTALMSARYGEERPFSEDEIISHLIVLFIAGYETAASLIGSMVLRLLREPALWEAVGQDQALLCAAMEETLRVDGPVQMEPRHTTVEALVGGVQIPAGATVFPFFGAASYDSSVFPDPLRFDPARREVMRHYGFGHGIHTCIGGPLARREVSIAVGELRKAFPRLRLADGARPAFQPSLFFRTLIDLPVTLDGGSERSKSAPDHRGDRMYGPGAAKRPPASARPSDGESLDGSPNATPRGRQWCLLEEPTGRIGPPPPPSGRGSPPTRRPHRPCRQSPQASARGWPATRCRRGGARARWRGPPPGAAAASGGLWRRTPPPAPRLSRLGPAPKARPAPLG